MGGLHCAGRSGAHSQPHTMCVFVCLVASKSVTRFGEPCKCEWGLPDGRDPERHKERAQRKGTRREHSVTTSCVAVSTLGLSAHGNVQITALGRARGALTKSDPDSPDSSKKLKKSGRQSGSISSSKVAQIWRKWQAWMWLSWSWCGAHRRDVGRQTDSLLVLGLIRVWIIICSTSLSINLSMH